MPSAIVAQFGVDAQETSLTLEMKVPKSDTQKWSIWNDSLAKSFHRQTISSDMI